ncbi:Rib/alpha-like domain-containing protein [Streptococcus constellatus]|uniref:Rib/alpha-like domain-containing protein n=1 Tax=Streptococcus constellatus TaxID=76860 RepID=UPI002001A180|nr:Rib/alpha-like domain-containing protein [Streptococcus constellatus]
MFKVNKKTYDISQTRQRFSIRKFKFGAASIAIATLMFLGSNAAVSATEITPKTATQGSVLNSEEITTVNNKEDKKQEEISSVSSDLTTNQANSTTETTKKVEKASETESSNNVADDLMSESAPKTTEISDLIKGAQFVTGSDTRDANWKPDDKLEDNSIAKTMAETGKGGITPLNWRSGITEITYSEFKNNDYSTGWSKKPGGNDNYADEIIRVRAQYDKKQDTIHWQIVIKGNASGTFMGVSKDFSRPYNLFTTSRGLHKPENLVVQEVGVDGETLKEKQGYPHNVDNWPSSSRKLYKPTKVNVNGKEVELLGSSSYMMTEWGSRWRLGNTGSNKEQGQKYNIEKHIYYSKYGFEDWLASSSQSGTRIYNFDTKINREELKELGQLPNVDSQFSDYMGWGKRFREDTNLVNKVWVTAGMTSREAGGNSITHPGGRGIYNFSKIATVDVSTLAKDADEYSPQYDNGSGYPNDTVNLKIKEKNNKQIPAGTTYKTEPNSPITVDQNTGEVTVKIPADAKPGSAITGNVTVTYPDGTVDTVPVNVTVKKYPDNIKYSPEAKHRTVEQHAELDAKDSIANTNELPSNSTYKWKDGHKPDTSTSGEKDGIVEVHYPDGTVDDVNVKVTVTSKKTDNTAPKLTVTPEQQTVKVDEDITFTVTVEDENEVTLGLDDLKAKYGKDIIAGRVKIEYLTNEANKKVMKVTIMKATLADKGAITFTAKDKAGNQAEPKTVTINVLPLKDKYEPKGKDQTVKVGETPKAEDSIGNVPELPKGTKFEYETPVDTTTPGDKDAKVIVTYPDGSKDEVPVKVHVTKTPTQADSNEPKGKDQTENQSNTNSGTKALPNTGETNNPFFTAAAMAVIVSTGVLYGLARNKKNEETE